MAVYLCMDPTIGVIDEASGLALRDVIAFVIFAVASITDFFDGMLARKNNWITSFGKFADPIAGKGVSEHSFDLDGLFSSSQCDCGITYDRKRLDC